MSKHAWDGYHHYYTTILAQFVSFSKSLFTVKVRRGSLSPLGYFWLNQQTDPDLQFGSSDGLQEAFLQDGRSDLPARKQGLLGASFELLGSRCVEAASVYQHKKGGSRGQRVCGPTESSTLVRRSIRSQHGGLGEKIWIKTCDNSIGILIIIYAIRILKILENSHNPGVRFAYSEYWKFS